MSTPIVFYSVDDVLQIRFPYNTVMTQNLKGNITEKVLRTLFVCSWINYGLVLLYRFGIKLHFVHCVSFIV